MSETKITREMITAFGDKLLNAPEIGIVSIDVSFNDGSKISYHKYSEELREK